MAETWGNQHRRRQSERGTPTRLTSRSAKASTDGMFKACKDCSGSGRVNKVNKRGRCMKCDGTGKIYHS
jgi:DnaJ-class molecular chaperone